MIKTFGNKILNINNGSILGDLYELNLKSNKETRLSGSNVEWWGDKKNGWFFKAPSGDEPIYDGTEEAIKWMSSNFSNMYSNKPFDYSKNFIITYWIKLPSISDSVLFSQRDYPTDSGYFFINITDKYGDKFFNHGYKSSGVSFTERRNYYQTALILGTSQYHHTLIYHDSENKVSSQYVDGKAGALYTYNNPITMVDEEAYIGRIKNYLYAKSNVFIKEIKIISNVKCDQLNGWTGSELKYSAAEQVFTPPTYI